MTLLERYLSQYNQTYREVNMMISGENAERLDILCKVLDENFESYFVNEVLKNELDKLEAELNVDLRTDGEDGLRKALNL